MLTQIKMKIAKQTIAQNEFSSYKNDIKDTLRKMRNGLVHAQGSEKTRHGKAGEIAICKLLNFIDQNGNVYEQSGRGCDVPKEIATRSLLPKELHHDIEVKYYKSKSGWTLMGDAEKKIAKIRKGLVLIKGYYDEDPKNPKPILHIEKISPNEDDQKAFDEMIEVAKFVKDYRNSVEKTREKVIEYNAKCKSKRFSLNNCSNSKKNSRQIQLVDRWS